MCSSPFSPPLSTNTRAMWGRKTGAEGATTRQGCSSRMATSTCAWEVDLEGSAGMATQGAEGCSNLGPRSGNRRSSRAELQLLGLLPAPHLRVCLLLDTDRTGACITTRAHRHACFSHSLWWAPHSLRAINPASAFIWHQCLLVAEARILQLLIKSSLSQPPRALPTLPAKS